MRTVPEAEARVGTNRLSSKARKPPLNCVRRKSRVMGVSRFKKQGHLVFLGWPGLPGVLKSSVYWAPKTDSSLLSSTIKALYLPSGIDPKSIV